jgi:membrane protease YdiL (CAAX protease family)
VSFFPLVFALSVPFWVAGAVTGLELLPGLPLAATMAFCPAVAAGILLYRDQGTEAVVRLLERSVDFRRTRRRVWYLPTLLLMPSVMLASYDLMRWMRVPLPVPEIRLRIVPPMLLAFMVAALAEELGWSGYATDRMQPRWGELRSGLQLGVLWAAWHLVPLIEVHRRPGWIAGWSVGTIANRVIIVRLYNATDRSVFAAALYHAMANLTWQLFPNAGSHYDPRVSAPLLALAAALMVASAEPARVRRRCETAT